MWLVSVVDAPVEKKDSKNAVALDFDRICGIVRRWNVLGLLASTGALANHKVASSNDQT